MKYTKIFLLCKYCGSSPAQRAVANANAKRPQSSEFMVDIASQWLLLEILETNGDVSQYMTQNGLLAIGACTCSTWQVCIMQTEFNIHSFLKSKSDPASNSSRGNNEDAGLLHQGWISFLLMNCRIVVSVAQSRILKRLFYTLTKG